MKTIKNKYIIILIELILSILITFVFSNLLHISNCKYLFVMFVLFFAIIFIYNYKKIFYSYKEYIKILIIMFVFSSLFLFLCIDTFKYKTTYLTIIPIKNEQNDKSNEVWIYGISINNKDVNFDKIENDSWYMVNDCIVYTGSEYNPLKIKIRNRATNIKIKYAKADNLTTKFSINNKTYETYYNEWNLETIKIKNLSQEKNKTIDIIISIICYYLSWLIFCIFLFPFARNKKYRYVIIISVMYLYSVYYYNSIFLITGIMILILLYALLRNWSVANEENNK